MSILANSFFSPTHPQNTFFWAFCAIECHFLFEILFLTSRQSPKKSIIWHPYTVYTLSVILNMPPKHYKIGENKQSCTSSWLWTWTSFWLMKPQILDQHIYIYIYIHKLVVLFAGWIFGICELTSGPRRVNSRPGVSEAPFLLVRDWGLHSVNFRAVASFYLLGGSRKRHVSRSGLHFLLKMCHWTFARFFALRILGRWQSICRGRCPQNIVRQGASEQFKAIACRATLLDVQKRLDFAHLAWEYLFDLSQVWILGCSHFCRILFSKNTLGLQNRRSCTSFQNWPCCWGVNIFGVIFILFFNPDFASTSWTSSRPTLEGRL